MQVQAGPLLLFATGGIHILQILNLCWIIALAPRERQIAKHFAENDWKPSRSALKKEYITEPVVCMVTF